MRLPTPRVPVRRSIPVRVCGAALSVLLVGATALVAARANHTEPATAFGTPTQIAAGDIPVGIATGDFDGDGLADLAFADQATGTVRVQRGTGDGSTFVSSVTPPVGGRLIGLAAGTIDGDARTDLAVVSDDGVRVLRSLGLVDGALAFSTHGPFSAGLHTSPEHVAVAQHDGSGGADLVVAGHYASPAEPESAGFVNVLLQAGTLDFAAGTPYPHRDAPSALAAGDLSGDGRAEIVVGFEYSSAATVHVNPANGSANLQFEDVTYVSTPLHTRSLTLADASGDGVPDVMAAGWSDPHFGQSYSSFTVSRTIREGGLGFAFLVGIDHTGSPEFAGAHVSVCTAADVDGDGDPEIIATAPLGPSLAVFHYDVIDGTTLVPGALLSFSCGAAPLGLVAAHLDPPDTRIDVAVVNGSGNQAHVLRNTTTPGGGGGDALPPAVGLALKAKALKDGSLPGGGKFTFTCRQTERAEGLFVRVQETLTPAVEASWTDVPGNPYMSPGKGRKAHEYKLVPRSGIPAGQRYFRTVTSAPGRPDGINLATAGPDAYIGPFTISSSPALLAVEATIIPAGDVEARQKTFPGDIVTFVLEARNEGGATARNVRVQARMPRDTTLSGVHPTEGHELLNGHTHEWVLPQLDPGESKTLVFAVTVVPEPRLPVIIFDKLGISADGGPQSYRIPSGRVELPVGTPLTLAVTPVQTAPQAGGLMEWDLVARNAGATTFTHAVVMDRLPRGSSFELAYFTDANGDAVTSPIAAPGGRTNPYFDREAGKVYWYLGDLEGQETVRMRLVTRVRYDVFPGSELVNGAWQLRACTPGATGCDPLQFDRLPGDSGEPDDIRVTLSETPPAAIPQLRLDQRAVVASRPLPLVDTKGRHVTAKPGDEVRLIYHVANTGGAEARNAFLEGNLPHGTTLVPNSISVRGVRGASGTSTPTFTQSSGGTVDIFLGGLPPNTAYDVEMRVRVGPTVQPRTTIVNSHWNLRTDALDGFLHASPMEISIYVANPFTPAVEVTTDRQDVKEGDVLRYRAAALNVGDLGGLRTRLVMSVPKGAVLVDDPAVDDDGIRLLDADGAVISTQPVNPNAKSVSFDLPLVGLGHVATGEISVRLIKAPKAGDLVCDASFTGSPLTVGGKKSTTETGSASGAASVTRDGNADLFVSLLAPISVRKPLEFDLTVIVGNKSFVDAHDVVITLDAPSQTKPTIVQAGEFGPDGRVRGRRAEWRVGTIPACTSVTRVFHVIVEDFASGCTLTAQGARVTASNAAERTSGPTVSYLLEGVRGFESYRFNSLGCTLQMRGGAVGGVLSAALDDAVKQLRADGLTASAGGTDLVHLTNGTWLMPLGGGNIVAAGGGNIVAAGGGIGIAAGRGRV